MTDFISICICTYRRPILRDTLRSISELDALQDYKTEIVISDNDETPSAKELVEAAGKEFGLSIKYVHAPKQNISIARNACLENAKGNLVTFIDDDEVVSPQWLLQLYKQMKSGAYDIVFGPVLAVYPEDSPEWMKQLNFHTKSIKTSNPATGYTANVMMDMTHEAIKDRKFNLGRGRTGGEDTQFFFECSQSGARLGYAPDAIIWEDVVPARLTLKYMLQFQFRSGLSLGLVSKVSLSFWQVLAKSIGTLSKITFCAVGALVTLPFRSVSRKMLIRAALHSGILAANFNVAEQVFYG